MGKGGSGSFPGLTGSCDSDRWEGEEDAQAQHAAPGNPGVGGGAPTCRKEPLLEK